MGQQAGTGMPNDFKRHSNLIKNCLTPPLNPAPPPPGSLPSVLFQILAIGTILNIAAHPHVLQVAVLGGRYWEGGIGREVLEGSREVKLICL